MGKRVFSWLIVILFPCMTQAQQRQQLWLDFQVSYPFANRFLLENTTSYQTVLDKNEKWRSVGISPTFEYSIFTWLDLLLESPMSYTQQTNGVSSFEFTPITGGRFYITQGRRIDTRVLCRYQVRAFRQLEEDNWQVSNRTRLRGEIYACVNGPNLFTDKLWYLFADYEEFFVLDQQVDERFANRRRARLGVGYRLSYKHRFDVSYTLQASRNELEGEFTGTDQVLQFKYKLYLNPQHQPLEVSN